MDMQSSQLWMARRDYEWLVKLEMLIFRTVVDSCRLQANQRAHTVLL